MRTQVDTAWPMVPMSRGIIEMCDGPFGSSLTSAHYTSAGPRVIRLGNIGQAAFRDDDEARISDKHFATLRRHAVRAGDLLVAGLGDEHNPLGRACVAPEGLGPAIVKADCFRFRLWPTVFDQRFVAWALSSTVGQFAVRGISRGSTRSRANLGGIASIRVPCPPVTTQNAVADFLDAETARIDAVVGVRRRQVGLLIERQRAACRAMVTGGETTYPVGPLRRWWTVIDCKHRTPAYVDDGIPLISTGEVKQGLLDLSRTDRYVSRTDYKDLAEPPRRPRRGDVIYGRNASLGAAAYVDTDEEFCMGQDVCLITSQAEDQRFLAYALDLVAREQLDARSIGSTFKRINVDQIKDLRVPHPPLAEQRRIAADCVRIDTATACAIAAIDRQIALLRERRKALITAAVTGRLQVPGTTTANAAA